MTSHLVVNLPLRRQQQVLLGERQVVKLKDARKSRPKRNRYAKIGTARKDLRAMIRHQSEARMAQFIRDLHAMGKPAGFTEVIFPTTIIRTKSYRNLVGTKATSARGRKHVLDFAGKKPVMGNDTTHGKATGTRSQKYHQHIAQRQKETKSYNRGAPTAAGGELRKTLGPINVGKLMTEEEAALDEKMRYAEATGQYDPWKETEEDQ